MSKKLDEERSHFQELIKELDETIRKSANAATNIFKENAPSATSAIGSSSIKKK